MCHLAPYLYNFLGQKEYQNISPTQVMILPYKRIVIIHLTVLFGGFVVVIAGGIEFIVLLLLILLKTVIDLTTHISEHSVKLKQKITG